jgi:hypothetical protein
LPRTFGGIQMPEENISGEKHTNHFDGKNPTTRGSRNACK